MGPCLCLFCAVGPVRHDALCLDKRMPKPQCKLCLMWGVPRRPDSPTIPLHNPFKRVQPLNKSSYAGPLFRGRLVSVLLLLLMVAV